MIKTRKISLLAHTILFLYILLLFWIIALKCNMEVTISDTRFMNAGTTLIERFRMYLSYRIFFVDFEDAFVNVMFFLPLGMVLPFIIRKHPYLNTVVWGALISIGFEVFQIVSCVGMFTYADIIFNTLGALIGAILHRALINTAKEKSLTTAFVVHILILIPVLIYAAFNTVNNLHLYF